MKRFSLIILVLVFSLTAFCQSKIGYFNSKEILDVMVEVKEADSTIAKTIELLNSELKKMSENFQEKTRQFIKDSSTFLPTIKTVKREELKTDFEKIKQFEINANKDLETQKNELIKPIFSKIIKASHEIAKEKGYDYIFDSSSTSFIFASPKDDLTSLIKKKLNLK